MAQQVLLDTPEEATGVQVVLLSLGRRHMHRKLVEVIEDGSTNLLVGGTARPEVRWRSAGNARHAPQG